MRIMQCLNYSAGYSTDLIELWNIHQFERSQKRELLGLSLEAQGIILCLFELSNRRPVIKKACFLAGFPYLVGLTGLLCTALELHRRTFAPGKPEIPPYRLVLVVKPAFSLVREPIILTIKKPPTRGGLFYWSGREDSNLRLLAPHASALPG